ncbi:MAG: type I glutamate--ammonia ligase [Clostridia bacterium]
MGKMTKEKIIKIVQEEDVRFIRLQFTDIFGMMKNISITDQELEKALSNECMFDGSSIEGFVRIEESDMLLYPDLDTFAIFPWQQQFGKVGRLICDVYTTDGKPFGGDPRNILKTVLAEAKSMGYTINVGPEAEFFLFQNDESGKPTLQTNDDAGYFDLAPIDQGENARRDMCIALQEMGFKIEASHHECGRGQHEIDFRYAEALKTADDIMTFKLVVKTIAKTHGLHATFMPKPIYGIAGNGMHINLSLLDEAGKNAFRDDKDEYNLSTIAYKFMAGVMEHARGMCLITNPLVNSYKRLVPGHEAPIYVAWSAKNRSPLIRVPSAGGNATRIELRNPDPSANPYLALAVAIAAGLDGIKRNLTPPPAVNINIFEMTRDERRAANIKALPEDIERATTAFEEDDLMRATLGEHLYTKYLDAKKIEYREYKRQVHPWEVERYLYIQ